MDYDPNSLDGNINKPDPQLLNPEEYLPNSHKSGSGFGRRKLSPFGFSKRALAITAAAFLVIVGIGGTFTYEVIHGISHKDNTQDQSVADKFPVSSLPSAVSQSGPLLRVTGVSKIAINGQLQVSNGLVIEPTATPDAPVLGQIYFDQSTHRPYYFDGSQFVSLKPTLTTIQGVGGLITLGGGMSIVNSTLVNDGVLGITIGNNTLTTTVVLQGANGISITQNGQSVTIDGAGLISGANVSKSGTQTANQLVSFDSNGNVQDSSLLDKGSGLQMTGGSYYLDLANASTSTLTVKNSTPGQVANLAVTGNVSAAGTVTANGGLVAHTLTDGSGSDLQITSVGNNIVFSVNGGAATFTLPTTGGTGQVICTSGISCTMGGGQAVILEPTSAQVATTNKPAIFINRTSGTGNLIQLQSSASDVFVVTSTGAVSISKTGVLTAINGNASVGGTLAVTGAISTSSNLQAAGNLFAQFGTSADTRIGNYGPGGESAVRFGNDTLIYRSAAATLNTGGSDVRAGNIYGAAGSVSQVAIGNMIGGNQAGIVFGTTGQANLYKSAASTLKTDSNFIAAGTATFQNATDSTNAFQIQNAAGTSNLLVADTTNSKVGIGKAPSQYTLDVNGTIGASSKIYTGSAFAFTTTAVNDGFMAHAIVAGTGGVGPQDVVVLNSSGQMVTTTTPRDPRVIGVSDITAVSGGTGYVVTGGNHYVKVDTGAVSIGDQLVTSATSGYATVDNSATTGIVGIALSPKAAGSTGSVGASIGVVRGQSAPIFRNASDSTSAFQIQNAAGTSNLFVADTTNSKLGIGMTPVSTGETLQVAGSINASSYVATTVLITSRTNYKYVTGTGGVSANDVVVVNSSGQIVDTTTPRDARVVGVAVNTLAAGLSNQVVGGGTNVINVDAGAVSVGDQLVTSSTAGRAAVDNNATTGIVGYAVTSKAAGSVGTVTARIQIVNGQNAPRFQNATDSTSAFQIQNAAGTSNLLVADTVNTRLAVGGLASAATHTLEVTGDINASSAIYVNGVAVCTVNTCAAGNNTSSFINNGTSTQTANFNIQTASSGSVAAIIQGATGQTADIFEVKDGVGNLQLGVNQFGNTYVGTANAVGGKFSVSAGGSTNRGIVVKGGLAQTGDLQQFLNNSGSLMLSVTAAGALQGGNASGTDVTGSALTLNGGQGTGVGNGGGINFNIFQAGGTNGSSNNTTASTVASIDGITGATTFKNTTNTANAFQVQNATGTNILNVDNIAGRVNVVNLGASNSVQTSLLQAVTALQFYFQNSNNGYLSKGALTTTAVTAGDVVVNTTNTTVPVNTLYVGQTTTPRDPKVFGVATATAASGSGTSVAYSGNYQVNVDTSAVTAGDQLVASATAGLATVDNHATTGIIGVALTNKVAGSNGVVAVQLNVIHGQYSPTFQNASDSTSAFRIQNAAGTSNLFVADTTNSKIGIGMAPNAADSTLQVAGDIKATTALYAGSAGNYYLKSTGNFKSSNIIDLGTATTFTGSGNGSTTAGSLFKNTTDSTTAFAIQNAAGTTNLLIADTTNGRIGIGMAPTTAGITLQVNGAISANNGINTNVIRSTGGGNRIFLNTTPSTGGLVNILGQNTTDINLVLASMAGQTGDFIQLQANGVASPVLKVGVTGAVVSQNSTDSTAAFQVQNAAGTAIFTADTTNSKVVVNASAYVTNAFCVGSAGSCSAGKLTVITAGTGAIINVSGTNDILQLQNSGTNVATVGATGNTLFKNSTDSTAAFQIQNAAGTALINVDTTTNQVNLAGVVAVTPTNINLGSGALIINPANASVGIGAAPVAGVKLAVTTTGVGERINVTSTSDILQLQNNGTSVLTVGSTGNTLLKNSTDSTTALLVQNAGGTNNLFALDTTNGKVGINALPTPTGSALQVGGSIAATGNILTSGQLQSSTATLVSSSATTGNLFNTVVTTLNIGGAATTINIGASTGTTSVKNNLTVIGSSNFSGTLTVTGMATFNGGITVGGHIVTSGTTPTKSIGASNVTGGTGSSCTISGNDTAGTIYVVAGTGTPITVAGSICFIFFNTDFGAEPSVVLGANDQNGASVMPYAGGVSSNQFTLGAKNTLTAGQSYTFSYHAFKY